MCLRDSLSKEDHGPQWGAFTFIKLPHIIKHLCEDSKSFKASEEVIQGFEMLLEMFPLLDFIDSHTACSSIELLLNELVKLEFVTENQCSSIIARRYKLIILIITPFNINEKLCCLELMWFQHLAVQIHHLMF